MVPNGLQYYLAVVLSTVSISTHHFHKKVGKILLLALCQGKGPGWMSGWISIKLYVEPQKGQNKGKFLHKS